MNNKKENKIKYNYPDSKVEMIPYIVSDKNSTSTSVYNGQLNGYVKENTTNE
jgi:hypothetical protein